MICDTRTDVAGADDDDIRSFHMRCRKPYDNPGLPVLFGEVSLATR